MARASELSDAELGGFDRSFLITMIRDFFVILVLVTVLEFALKAALVVWDFDRNAQARVEAAAQDVAENVRAIMLNEGGPVAARTLYPILQDTMGQTGFQIAIEPSPVTVASIEQSHGFTPRGAPPAFPEGRHAEARVELRAEAFCLACHVQAEVGDLLGTVTARTYLAREIDAWWAGLQLTGLLSLGKIVLHSILLFVLLKVRMAPLMALRAAVGGLSRAFGRLDARVEVRSQDEFGALARDLNLFLERLQRVMSELDAVLRKVVSVNDDIVRIQTELRDRLDAFVSGVRAVERRAMLAGRREPMLSAEWFEAMREGIEALRVAGANADPAALADRLAAVVGHAEAQAATNMALFEDLARLGEDSGRFQIDLAEMGRLEERLRGVIETGAGLLARLQGQPTPARAG